MTLSLEEFDLLLTCGLEEGNILKFKSVEYIEALGCGRKM